MGLVVDSTYGTPVVHHGGDMIGYHSDMIWLPEHNVGAVILTNGDPGWALRGPFQRKLLEVLFDGRPQADADVPAQAKASSIGLPRIGSCSWCPAASDVREAGDPVRERCTRNHHRPARGRRLCLTWVSGRARSARGAIQMGRRRFLTIAPGILFGLEFVVGSGPQPTLIARDGQHEYVFAARDAPLSR